MIFVFRVLSPALPDGTPANDLHLDEWTFQDLTLESATSRALHRLTWTFEYASPQRVAATSLEYVGSFDSYRAYDEARIKAEESGAWLTEARARAEDRTDVADEIDCRRERAS